MRRMVLWCAARLYRAYYATLRVRAVLPHGGVIAASDHVMAGQIFAVCERDTLALSGLMADRRFVVLVAHGRDGDWASALLDAIGCRVVRGSSRRGGARALLRLLRDITASTDPVAIVVDGPLGPAGIAKPGAIVCGFASARPVRAVGVASRWALRLPRTWSGIYVPVPFSTVIVTYVSRPDRREPDRDVHARTKQLTEDLAAARHRAVRELRARQWTWNVAPLWRPARSALVWLRDAFLAAVAVPFLLPLWYLPWDTALRVGRWYGDVVWAVWPAGRRVGVINMRRVHGDTLSRRAARGATRQVFESLGQSIAEGIQFARRYKRSPDRARLLYECEDPDLDRRIREDPRPRIFVTGHLGSWELAGGLAALSSARPGAVIVRRIDNPFLNALWRTIRVRERAEWIEKRGAAQEALRRLRRGEDIAMLLDENAGPRGVFVPFLGRLASTSKSPAVLSLATGAPVIVGACMRRPNQPFLFRLAMLEPDRALPPEQAITDLTARIVAAYESWIRDAPLQWRWIHWRWKARPDGSEERYGRGELRQAFQPGPKEWPRASVDYANDIEA